MTLRHQVPEQTKRDQDRASNPRNSAWVSANAGSGKTHVLSKRVVRLLLDGAEPSRILCLTYTKAAAANMANRVFKDLARWATLPDGELAKDIATLEGREPSPGRMERARQLFALALETPGGLKIQTIHAFCEAVLHQFPLEANIAGHFELLDQKMEQALVAEARQHMLTGAGASHDPALASAFASVLQRGGESGLEALLKEIVGKREAIHGFIDRTGATMDGFADLLEEFDFAPGTTAATIAAGHWPVPGFDVAYVRLLRQAAERADARSVLNNMLPDMEAGLAETDPAARLRRFIKGMLKADGSAYGDGQFKAALRKMLPDLAERYREAADMLVHAGDRLALIEMLDVSIAALTVADGLIARYERLKTARGFLDFNDLIGRTIRLLARTDAGPWVQYRLDRGIDHILVDEAQDTSPGQWSVITKLADDFFTGQNARENVDRTVFAVGDEKQSIYSFQGAEPAAFAETREVFRKRVDAAGYGFENVRLQYSFRSTDDVLHAVDTVFAGANSKGLTVATEDIRHYPIRTNEPGHVDVWSSLGASAAEEPDDWTLAIDHASAPAVLLANRIARTVKFWIDGGERIEGTGGRVSAGDVLVLVRKRDSFVHALSRALKNLHVPVAGADRLDLKAHIAVKDLIALGRVVLQPADDLSLAALLRSPVFGLSEEQLFGLAHGRGRGVTLWQALRRAAESDAALAPVAEALAGWRAKADLSPPFEFYADILGRDGVRRKMLARLGHEAGEILDEFLNFCLAEERAGLPGLEAFLTTLENAGPEIKREMDQGRDEVRIMTVHAAKGLEAPIVFLVDPGSAPFSPSHLPRLTAFPSRKGLWQGPGFLWRASKDIANGFSRQVAAAFQDRAEDEYRRLLYVAMTRAQDRLIVCGYHGRAQNAASWHAMVEAALAPHAEARGEPDSADFARRYRVSPVGEPRAHEENERRRRDPGPMPPLGAPPPRPTLPRPLAPSGVSTMIGMERADAAPIASPVLDAMEEPSFAATRGIAVHRLLQLLPGIDPEKREAPARRYLERYGRDWTAAQRDAVWRSVDAVLGHPAFGAVFEGESRAEVAIMGVVTLGGREHAVSAKIDRLRVTPERVLIVDYKTTRPPPASLAEVDLGHVAQMALYRDLLAPLYPERRVEAALLYTETPRLIMLDETAMATSLARLALS